MKRKSNSPNLDDLRWEIIRRSEKYREDYMNIGQSQLSAIEAAGVARKWGLREMMDPELPWDQTTITFPSGKTRTISPAAGSFHSKNAVSLLLSDKQHLPGLAYLEIDPLASIADILVQTERMVKHYRKINFGSDRNPGKAKIAERLNWLNVYDRVARKNASPTKRTLSNLFKNSRSDKRKFAKGSLLVSNPTDDPLRGITDADADAYLKSLPK